jgi:hypothetical protein
VGAGGGVAVAVGDGVGVNVGLGVPVGVAVSVGLGVSVAVGVGVGPKPKPGWHPARITDRNTARPQSSTARLAPDAFKVRCGAETKSRGFDITRRL